MNELIYVECPNPPFLVKYEHGTFICPTWQQVPDDTKECDLVWVPMSWKPEYFDVPGRPYKIKLERGEYSCSCPGHKYHGHCKHLDAFLEERE
jgi:hypothetical protein